MTNETEGVVSVCVGRFPPAVKLQIDILELKDLEKEYILARSRLTLAQHYPPAAAIAGTSAKRNRASGSQLVGECTVSQPKDHFKIKIVFKLNIKGL